METLQLGPFYINWRLLVMIIGCMAGYLSVLLVLRRSAHRLSPLPGLLQNTLLIGLFSWKLAPFLFHPSMLWQSPLKGLLLAGGDFEAAAGVLAAAVYLLWRSLRSGLPLRLIADAGAYGMIGFWLTRSILGGWRYGKPTDWPWGITLSDPALGYHPLNVYELLLALLLVLVIAAGKLRPGTGEPGRMLLMIGGAGLFAISLAQLRSPLSGLFSTQQWVALAMLAIGLFSQKLYILWEAYQERRGYNMARNDNSKAQKQQDRANERAAKQSPEPEQAGYDRKLDGPNRPAE